MEKPLSTNANTECYLILMDTWPEHVKASALI